MKPLLDKFYTKPEIAELCVRYMAPFIKPDSVIIEPSAGEGSFIDACRKIITNDIIGFDIEPGRDDIIQKDWFSVGDADIPSQGPYAVLGNPPFGKRNNMTNRFIRHAVKLSNCIGFILPTAYRKETAQKVFPDNWKLHFSELLPEHSFLVKDSEYHIPCVFQIWSRNGEFDSQVDIRESIKPKRSTDDFVFSSKEDADWFMFGAAPHRIIHPSEVTGTNRGYYFRADEFTIEILRNIDWKAHACGTASGGVAWYSKQQIIDIYIDTMNNKED